MQMEDGEDAHGASTTKEKASLFREVEEVYLEVDEKERSVTETEIEDYP